MSTINEPASCARPFRLDARRAFTYGRVRGPAVYPAAPLPISSPLPSSQSRRRYSLEYQGLPKSAPYLCASRRRSGCASRSRLKILWDGRQTRSLRLYHTARVVLPTQATARRRRKPQGRSLRGISARTPNVTPLYAGAASSFSYCDYGRSSLQIHLVFSRRAAQMRSGLRFAWFV